MTAVLERPAEKSEAAPGASNLRWYYLTLAGLTLAAFVLRLNHLTFESFWLDEADSVRIASAPIAELISRLTQVGENGPLYHLILRPWMSLTGTGEFAVRFLSLLAGVLTVPVFGALGTRLGTRRLGLITATLGLISSFLVYYSQEAKMYSIVVLLSALSGYLLVRAFDENRKRLWLAFLAITSLAMYTHVFAALLIPASFVFAILRPRANRRAWKGFTLAFLGLTLPYLPIGIWEFHALQLPKPPVGSYYGAPAFPDLIRLLLKGFGTTQPGLDQWLVWAVFGGLALAGLLPTLLAKDTYSKRLAYLAAYFLAPCILAAILFSRMPIFLERYMTPVLPPLFVAMAASGLVLVRFWRPLAIVPVLVFLYFNAPPLIDAQLRGQTVKEDWRPATKFIEGRMEPGDLLVFLSVDSWIGYDYYATKPYERLGSYEISNSDPDKIDAPMQKYTAGFRRYWLVLSEYAQEDREAMETWMVRNATKVDERGFKDVLVSLWMPAPPGRWEAHPSHPASLDFDGRFSLIGYDLADANGNTLRPRCTLVPDNCTVKLTLYWKAGAKLDKDIRVSTRLTNASREVWGQFDLSPSPFYKLTGWRPDAIYREERYIPVLPGMPAGAYDLRFTAYDAESGTAVPIKNGNKIASEASLTTLNIQEPDGGWPERAVPPGASGSFGQAQLLSGTLSPQTVTVGQELQFVGFWHLPDGVQASAMISLDRGAEQAAQWEVPLPEHAGLVANQSPLRLPSKLAPGRYEAKLRLKLDGNMLTPVELPIVTPDAIKLADIDVEGRDVQYDDPTMEKRLNARFADGTELAGYTLKQIVQGQQRPVDMRLDRDASAVVITLYWKASGPTKVPYTVFTHILGTTDTPVAQEDGPPPGVPSTAWLNGEIIADRKTIPIDKLKNGTYRIIAGLYDADTGTRLATPSGATKVDVAQIQISGREN